MTDTIDSKTVAVMSHAPGSRLAAKIATEDLAAELME
jgi:hypothetical protein